MNMLLFFSNILVMAMPTLANFDAIHLIRAWHYIDKFDKNY